MRIDWLPFSASALVAGATALAVGALLMPTVGGAGESLLLVQQEDQRWLAVALLFFVAACALIVGLPSVLTLMSAKSARLGLVAVGIFAVGVLGTAGYAMLLAFFRALVLADSIRDGGLDELMSDAGLGVFLVGWIGAFYLGEALIAVALLQSRAVPKWAPALLLLHVLSLPLQQLLPDTVAAYSVMLFTVGLSGIGIAANTRHLAPSLP